LFTGSVTQNAMVKNPINTQSPVDGISYVLSNSKAPVIIVNEQKKHARKPKKCKPPAYDLNTENITKNKQHSSFIFF